MSDTQIFDFMQCFDRVTANWDGYDAEYCVGNLLILCAALANAVILSCMFTWHLLEVGCDKAVKDTRTLIYVLLIGISVVVAIDYTFVLGNIMSDVVVIVTFNLATFGFMAVCYYFIEGASKLLDEAASIMKFMRIFTISAVALTVTSVLYISWEVYQNEQASPGEYRTLCKTWYFIPPSVINAGINIVFFTQARKISNIFSQIKERQLKMIQYDDTVSRQRALLQISKRDRAICELMLIVSTFAFVNAYDLLYTLTLYYFAQSSCEVFSNTLLWSVTTCTSRFIADILWVYPIIHYFWPGHKACCFLGRKTQKENHKESLVERSILET